MKGWLYCLILLDILIKAIISRGLILYVSISLIFLLNKDTHNCGLNELNKLTLL